MLDEDRRDMESKGKVDHRQMRDFENTIEALDLAERRGLRFHASLSPLGHTDFGIYTIFPHCPFCKAVARVERWQRRYPSEQHTCHACGTRYSPVETASSTRDDFNEKSLRESLGAEPFRRFAKEYLMARGETPEAADEIVAETEADELKREETLRLAQWKANRGQEFLQLHVFAGLPCLPPPKGEYVDGDDEPERKEGSTGWFDGPTFAEVLRRCKRWGIKVAMLQHCSSDERYDRFQMGDISDPAAVLSSWESEGCNESFHANCVVPDSLIENQT
jgi:hypothetical protein